MNEEGFEGFGFAIPINKVTEIVENLIKYKYVKGRPQIGIVVEADYDEEFAKDAEVEGFDHIAYLLREVGKIEKQHEQRYLELLKNLEEETMFKKEEKFEWRCMNCGHIHEGKEAPGECPVCSHPRAYFEIKCDEF